MQEPFFFPAGPGGACHPLNIDGFRLETPECAALYAERGGLWDDWEWPVRQLSRLAAEVSNCSSVQQCGLVDLFVYVASVTTPGYWGFRQPAVQHDPWRVRFYQKLADRARRLHRRELAGLYRQHRAAFAQAEADAEAEAFAGEERRPLPGEVALGMHVDTATLGSWHGQVEAWRAYAEFHGLRFLVDDERYFDGNVFASFAGLYWASKDAAHVGFERGFDFLRHVPGQPSMPVSTFHTASVFDEALLDGLSVLALPPQYWDSFEALAAVLPRNKWTLWLDYDFTISPCCFETFSLLDLIQADEATGHLPHVVIRDSPHEDYSHHCANSGFVIVRNSAVGRLFVKLTLQKRQWPAIPYADQSAMAESLLELLGMEMDWRSGARPGSSYHSECMPFMATLGPNSIMSYANFCTCFRKELRRLAGPEGARSSRWVQFVTTGRHTAGVEPGLLFASLFLHRVEGRGLGWLPLTSWSRDRHRAHADAWMPPDAEMGGPCAMLPLMIHWASVPHRPRLLYEFLNARFPTDLPVQVLVNGTAEEIGRAYRSAGLAGNAVWRDFLDSPKAGKLLADWGYEASAPPPRSACALGSNRIFASGGWTRSGRSTRPNEHL